MRSVKPMPCRLVEPRADLEDAFFDLAAEVRDAEGDFAAVAAVRRDGWVGYLARLRGLRDGSVPSKAGVPLSTFWWLDDDGRLLGLSGLRHRLTPALRRVGGHVGFAIRPTARGRGHAVALCRATLDAARATGLGRALLTCDAGNAGSRATIARCGGVLEAAEAVEGHEGLVHRYWIELGGYRESVPG